MRALSFLMFLLFAWCCALQYNDPDTWVWIGLYAFPGVLSLLYVLKKSFPRLSLAGAAGYIAYALYWYPWRIHGFRINNEEVREAGGLLIAGVWLGILGAWTLCRRQRAGA